MIEFFFTPEEAQPTALAVHRHLENSKFTVLVEQAVDEAAPLRPTLVADANELRLLIECQGDPSYTESLKELVKWATVERVYGEVYIATSEEKTINLKDLDQMHHDGVGRFLVDKQGNVRVSEEARNPALMVSLDKRLKLAHHKTAVEELIRDFNKGNRKGALGNMCELVEQETKALAVKAVKKKWLNKTEQDIDGLDWSGRIDVLGSDKVYVAGRTRVVDPKLKNDLHSFRGARNLFDHPAPTKKEKRDREMQYAERIMMGPRLIEVLIGLKRKVK